MCDQFTRKNLQHTNKESLTHYKVLEIDNLSQTFGTRDCHDFNYPDSTIVRSIPFVNEPQEVLLLAIIDGLLCRISKIVNEAQEVLRLAGLDGPVYACQYAFWNPLTVPLKLLAIPKDSIQQKRFNGYNITNNSPTRFGQTRFPSVKVFISWAKRVTVLLIVIDFGLLFSRCLNVGGELWRMDGDGDRWTKVKDFPPVDNHPWTYDDEKIDIENLPLNFILPININRL
nr:hypothetical protein [Tanacetum cinerariifolium]